LALREGEERAFLVVAGEAFLVVAGEDFFVVGFLFDDFFVIVFLGLREVLIGEVLAVLAEVLGFGLGLKERVEVFFGDEVGFFVDLVVFLGDFFGELSEEGAAFLAVFLVFFFLATLSLVAEASLYEAFTLTRLCASTPFFRARRRLDLTLSGWTR